MSDQIVGPVARPELPAVLETFGHNLVRGLNCMLVGEIAAYDAATNTAQVQIALERQLIDGRTIPFPILTDCPVVYLNGGGAFLSFPITAGDPCMVIFSDRSIDEWWQSGEAHVPAINRAHSLSDGIVLIGPRPQTSTLAVDGSTVTLNGGSHKLRVRNTAKSLKTLVDSMLDLFVGMSGTVSGSVATITVPSAVTVNALKAEFAALLEE